MKYGMVHVLRDVLISISWQADSAARYIAHIAVVSQHHHDEVLFDPATTDTFSCYGQQLFRLMTLCGSVYMCYVSEYLRTNDQLCGRCSAGWGWDFGTEQLPIVQMWIL